MAKKLPSRIAPKKSVAPKKAPVKKVAAKKDQKRIEGMVKKMAKR